MMRCTLAPIYPSSTNPSEESNMNDENTAPQDDTEVETTTTVEASIETLDTSSPEAQAALEMAREAAQNLKSARDAASTRGSQVDRNEVDRQTKQLTAFSLLALAEQGHGTTMIVNNYGPESVVEYTSLGEASSLTVSPADEHGEPTPAEDEGLPTEEKAVEQSKKPTPPKK